MGATKTVMESTAVCMEIRIYIYFNDKAWLYCLYKLSNKILRFHLV